MTRKEQPKQAAPKQEPKQQEQPKEAKPTQQQPKEQPKEQQPKKQPTKKPPVVKRITMEYFMKFNTSNSRNRKSWVKETIERATNEPVMVKNLTRGQIMALISQIDRYNMNTDRKIIYKYDVKRGIVLLAPKDSLIARLKQQEGEQK